MYSAYAEDMEYTIGSIEGGGTFHFPVVITGLVLGKHQLVVGVDSDSVELVTGEAEVCVRMCMYGRTSQKNLSEFACRVE